MTNSSVVQHKEFKTDLGSLIKIFGDHLYAEADVFIRELVQNAHDSIQRRADGPPGEIYIDGDRETGTVVFRDNGVGMSEGDIETYLTTIGGSGTRASREVMLQGGLERAYALIGQFGIGLLSAFVVAEEVVVETRKAEEPTGFRLTARGGPGYELTPVERAEIGTTVTLRLKDSCLGLSDPATLREAIRRYCDFLPYPIYVNGEQANTAHAPWHRAYASVAERRRAFIAWVEARSSDTPLLVIPVALQDPHVEGVLYVSDRRVPDLNMAGVVDVYQARMFVRRADPDLLPPWAKFVGGVIDSTALTLTASRDAVRKDAQHERVREALGELIVEALRRLAEEAPRRFRLLMRWHHYHVKGMALRHDDFFAAVADLVPFEIMEPDAGAGEAPMLTLPEYRARQNAVDDQGRTLLYYIGESEGTAPFYQLCAAQDLLVLNAGLVFEESFLVKYAEHHADTVALRCLDVANSEVLFTPLSEAERVPFLDLEYRLGHLLNDVLPDYEFVVRAERFLPSNLPALLTHAQDAETRHRLRVLKEHPAFSEAFAQLIGTVLETQEQTRQSAVLHLNAASEVVQLLRQEPFGHPVVQSVWQLICHNALLSGPYVRDPSRTAQFQQVSFDALQHVVALLRRHRDLEQSATHQWVEGLTHRTAHTSVYLLRASDETGAVLEQALRLVLEDAPFWFEVISSLEAPGLSSESMEQVHGFLVSLDGLGPEDWIQLGAIGHGRGDRPWVVLHPAGELPTPTILHDAPRVAYARPSASPNPVAILAEQLRPRLADLDGIQHLKDERALRYLSRSYLQRVLEMGEDATLVDTLTATFTTIEELLAADFATIAQQTGLDDVMARQVKAVLASNKG